MKKHIFLLVLTLVVAFSAGQLGYAQTSYAKTITIDQPNTVKSITEFAEDDNSTAEIPYTRVLVKNGMTFNIRIPNGYSNIERSSGKYTIHTDSQGTYLRFTGAGFFGIRYKKTAGGILKSFKISGDVNYYGVLQLGASATSATQDAPTKIAVVSPDDARIGQVIGGFHYVSENYVLSVPSNAFGASEWNVSLENPENFVLLQENIYNMSLATVLSEAKTHISGFSEKFKLKVTLKDRGSTNLLNDGLGTSGGISHQTITLKDERTVQYTLTTESHHPTWGTAQPATQTVNAGTEVTLQATPKTGYRFVGWAVGTPSFIVANDNPYQPAINENVRFIAVFEPLPLQITAKSNNTAWGSVSPESQTLNAGQTAKVTAMPVAPHKFKHWVNTATQAVVSTQAEYSFTVNENSSLTAVFEQGVFTYNVTAKSNNTAWGSVSHENQTLNAGQTAKVTATPVAPHKFKHWINTATQAVVSTQAEYSFTVNENSSLTAVFEEGVFTYNVTAKSNNTAWGSVSPENQTLNAGQTAKVTATSVAPHKFKHWVNTATQAVVSTQAEYSFTVNENSSLTAVFEEGVFTYNVTAKSNNTAWGSVSPESQTLNAGQTAKVTATPVAPHKFKHWINTATQAVVSTQAEYSFTVNENSSLTAVFEEGVFTYNVTAKSNNTAWGSVSPENQTLNAGQTAKVTATPVAPHKFKHWVNTATQVVVSTQAEYSFTVNENSSLTAVFEEVILLDPNAVLPHLTGLDTAVLKTGTPQTFVWEDMPQNATNFKATLIDMSNASAVTALVSTIDATQAQLEFAKAGTFTLMIHFEVLGVSYTVSYDGIVVK
ncbi:InlB B-repeat-containing protein [Capnocytophaga canimorsus]|uniref:InlB B-repeat-containing protein n=1 Tax=Capnocytophaga canimorsus TaxID=28188 RepID=UPI0037CDBE07